MKRQQRDQELEAALASCFGPAAWPWEVISPDLRERSSLQEIAPQQWVTDVVRRIPAWARAVLKVPASHALDDTCQAFCLVMIERRPDLMYDSAKGSKAAFLAGVLWHTHWRGQRAERRHELDHDVDSSLMKDPAPGPAVVAEQGDLASLLRQWVSELPLCQQLALGGDRATDGSHCRTRNALHIRRCRAKNRLRARADAHGLRDRRPRASLKTRCPQSRALPPATRSLLHRLSLANSQILCHFYGE